jgi:hypothetical protein
MDEFGGVYLDTEGHLPGLHRQIPQTAVSGRLGELRQRCGSAASSLPRPWLGTGCSGNRVLEAFSSPELFTWPVHTASGRGLKK